MLKALEKKEKNQERLQLEAIMLLLFAAGHHCPAPCCNDARSCLELWDFSETVAKFLLGN